MRIEILNGDSVIDTIVADEAFAQANYPGAWRVAADQGLPVIAGPDSCSPAQGLIALNVLHGVTEQAVADAIASIPDPATRYTAQIAFSRATEWRRSSATMQQMAAMLKLTDADLDALFTFAVTVEV